MPDANPEPALPPEPAVHLKTMRGDSRWIPTLAPIGLALLIVIAVLTVFSPSAIWFLLYPLLIIGALWALATAAAFLLRHF